MTAIASRLGYAPQPYEPLQGNLFDVIPPDDPDEKMPADEGDWQWYRNLRDATASVLLFLVNNVRDHYDNNLGATFNRRTARKFHLRCRGLSQQFLDRDPSAHAVKRIIERLARQFDVIVHSTEPGPKLNWPRPGQKRFDLDDARHVIDRALRAQWPTPEEVR